MNEFQDVAASMALTEFKTYSQCERFVLSQMMGETGTIREGVTEALWRRYKAAWPVDPFEQRVLHDAGTTRTGAILRAVFGDPNSGPQTFGRSATVTSDGYIMCNYTDHSGVFHSGAFVGSADDLKVNILRLITHMKLTDAETANLMTAVDKWIVKDWRFKNSLFV